MDTIRAQMSAVNTRIDFESALPYYVQVQDALRAAIDQGDLQAGMQLPGEPELCLLFNVSRTVIRHALDKMEQEGLIVRRKGKGTFVSQPKIGESLVQRLTGFHQDMVERGHTPTSMVLKLAVIPCGAKIAKRLQIAPDTPVIELERLRFADGEPINLVTSYLPYALCPHVAETDFSTRSLYDFLEQDCGLVIARGRRMVEVALANAYEARLLHVKLDAPLLLLDSVSYLEDGTPIEFYHARHRGDRARFEVELIRIRERGAVREMLGGLPDDLPGSW